MSIAGSVLSTLLSRKSSCTTSRKQSITGSQLICRRRFFTTFSPRDARFFTMQAPPPLATVVCGFDSTKSRVP